MLLSIHRQECLKTWKMKHHTRQRSEKCPVIISHWKHQYHSCRWNKCIPRQTSTFLKEKTMRHSSNANNRKCRNGRSSWIQKRSHLPFTRKLSWLGLICGDILSWHKRKKNNVFFAKAREGIWFLYVCVCALSHLYHSIPQHVVSFSWHITTVGVKLEWNSCSHV